MSTDPDADAALAAPETFDPFAGCPWRVYLNRLSECYMQRERGDFVPLGDHHVRWADRFAAGEDFTLLAHRFGLKTFVVLGYLTARLQYDPGFTALWITNTETQAKDKAHREFNKLTARAPFLSDLHEDVRTEDTIQTKRFPNGSALHAGWLNGGLEGARADCIVFDDIIKEKGDGKTEDIWEWCAGAAMPIGKRNSQEVFIGTRKRPGDLYEYIERETAYDIVEWPLIRDRWLADREHTVGEVAPAEYYDPMPDPLADGPNPPTVEVLWPRARNAEFIRDKFAKTGATMFNRAYCLVVGDREGMVYQNFSRQAMTTSAGPDALEYYFNGLDWGSGHPAGIIQFARGTDGLYVLDEVKAPADGTDFYTSSLRDLWSRHGTGIVACDPADKRGIQDLQAEGIDAVAAENDVAAGIREVKDLIGAGELHIHERCTELLDELAQYRYNDKTGRPVKANDHLCLAEGTQITTPDGERPIENISRGDMVLTRGGPRRVTAATQTGENAVVDRVHLSNGETLTGTPNHPIHTPHDGFKQLDALRYGEPISSIGSYPDAWPTQTRSNITASSSDATRTATILPTGATIVPTPTTSGTASKRSTEKSGKTTTAKSPTGTTSTIRTATRRTTISRIWSALRPPSILNGMMTSAVSKARSIWKRCLKPRRGGTSPRKAESGIASIGTNHSVSCSRTRKPNDATNAVTSSSITHTLGSVQTPVRQSTAGSRESTTRRESAKPAGRSSPATNTATEKRVHVVARERLSHGRDVYNLAVDGNHEYFANGVLTHNCDALRYGVMAEQDVIGDYHDRQADRDDDDSGVSYV